MWLPRRRSSQPTAMAAHSGRGRKGPPHKRSIWLPSERLGPRASPGGDPESQSFHGTCMLRVRRARTRRGAQQALILDRPVRTTRVHQENLRLLGHGDRKYSRASRYQASPSGAHLQSTIDQDHAVAGFVGVVADVDRRSILAQSCDRHDRRWVDAHVDQGQSNGRRPTKRQAAV